MFIINSKDLAKSVDAYCSFYGISKKQFHDESGVSSGTLSQWRKGMYEADKKSIMKLLQYTGLTIDELLSGNFSAVYNEKTATKGDGNNSEVRDYLNQIFDQLNSENQLRAIEKLQELKLEQLTQGFRKESD